MRRLRLMRISGMMMMRVDWDDEEEGLFNAMAVNKEGDQSKSSD